MNLDAMFEAVRAAEEFVNSATMRAAQRELQLGAAILEANKCFEAAAEVDHFFASICAQHQAIQEFTENATQAQRLAERFIAQQNTVTAAFADAAMPYAPAEPRLPSSTLAASFADQTPWCSAMDEEAEPSKPDFPKRTIVRPEVRRRIGFRPPSDSSPN